MQKLISFRIQDFRSIVDSGWKNMPTDNIAGFIGQNESGKTSILQALHSFSVEEIDEDVLRRVPKMPQVAVTFSYDAKMLLQIGDNLKFPDGLKDVFDRTKRISLKRKWISLEESVLSIEDRELQDVYKRNDEQKQQRRKLVDAFIEKTTLQYKDMDQKAKELSDEQKNLEEQMLEIEKQIKQLSNTYSTTTDTILKEKTSFKLRELETELKTQDIRLIDLKSKLLSINSSKESIIAKIEIIESYNNSKEELLIFLSQVEVARAQIVEVEKKITGAGSPELKKPIQAELTAQKKVLKKANDSYESTVNNMDRIAETLYLISEGKNVEEAETIIHEINKENHSFVTIDELAKLIFKYLPSIELFEDFGSLLPNEIDLDDLEEEKEEVEGYYGVQNFLHVAGIDLNFFKQQTRRIRGQQINEKNDEVSIDFQEFWRQKIGKTNKIRIQFNLENRPYTDKEKSGKPYISFWIKDGSEMLYPKQRSKGVRWFLSFYLQLKAYAKQEESSGRIILIDEPGNSLHALAQKDVLKVFEEIKDKIQIIYTTHSPYFLSLETVHRIIAVQRVDSDDEKSETKIFTAHELGAANVDTLSPLFTCIGASITDGNVINKTNNVLLEEPSAFYYLMSFIKLLEVDQDLSFVPATGCSNVSIFANLFLGWGLYFIIVIDDDSAGRAEYAKLKENLFGNNDDLTNKRMIKIKDGPCIEDLFTKTDFKKYVLNDLEAEILDSNASFMKDKKLPKAMYALKFYMTVQKKEISFSDFNKSTQDKFKKLLDQIITLMQNYPSFGDQNA